MGSPVFISYSSIDHKVAESICAAVEARGYGCWIAYRDVGPGENFQESIVEAIRSAKVMLLVFTGNANNSHEIRKELVLASRFHVAVVPLRVEDVAPNDALAYEFATRQWIDLFKDWERGIERLGERIGSILAGAQSDGGAAPATAAGPAPAGIARKPVYRRLVPGFATLAVLLAVGGAYLYGQPAALISGLISPRPPQTAPDAEGKLPELDETSWSKAVKGGTIASFNDYLTDHPNGAHAVEARQRLADLEAAQATTPAQAARFEGTWHGLIYCDRLSFTKTPLKLPIDITIAGGTVSSTRKVINATGSAVIGSEEGTGSVTGNGAIKLSASFNSIERNPRYTYSAIYEGNLSADGGNLQGTQIWSYDGKTENRSCSIAIKR